MSDTLDEADDQMRLREGWGLSPVEKAMTRLLPQFRTMRQRIVDLEARVAALEAKRP